ncbi:Hypothetical predicted protein [Cloeon dipterum]|uniref:Activating molecule in BECN1-regulated autophagy protein 1 n=2 Tax=Cloeon dipterum TaxID=197152 RepID=A0A8S1CXA1_9INSE|nr:Hypothetical predicted protein [Cloeon dipterum]
MILFLNLLSSSWWMLIIFTAKSLVLRRAVSGLGRPTVAIKGEGRCFSMAENEGSPDERGETEKKDLSYARKCRQDLPSALLRRDSGYPDHGYGRRMQVAAEKALVGKEGEYADRQFEIPTPSKSTFLMVFSPNGKLVASTHGDHSIYVSNVASGKCIRQLKGHPRTPWCLAFHPANNNLLASGCLGGEVRVWDRDGASEVWSSGGQTVIASLAFHPTSDSLLVIATHNELHFWDWNRKVPFMKICTNHDKERVRFVTFDATGHLLITGIANRLMYTSVIETNEPQNPIQCSVLQQRPSYEDNTASTSTLGSNLGPQQSEEPAAETQSEQQSRLEMEQRPAVMLRTLNDRLRSEASSSGSTSSSSSSPPASSSPSRYLYLRNATASAAASGAAGSEERGRSSLPPRRSSMSAQTRRRVPVSSSFLARNEASRTLSSQQNRRLFVREFANQLFSMFASYVHEMSSDSENDGLDPEPAPSASIAAARARVTAAIESPLTERYRRYRPLRVGRWNTNFVAQGNFAVHSPSEMATEGNRAPTIGERGYIFANIHVNHRIQCWTFSAQNFPPDITDSSKNIVVPKCKINNDSSVSISSCNQMLAAIIPEFQTHDVKINVYSMAKDTLGLLLFTHSLVRNVVSVSFSPSAQFLLVGFAANRLLAFRRDEYPMAQIFEVCHPEKSFKSGKTQGLEFRRSVMQKSDVTCTYKGINCMRWTPISGQGMMYGTNTGELRIMY